MNNDIKEILDKLKSNNYPFVISSIDINKLLDYITNLQEENERLKQYIDFYEDLTKQQINIINDYKSRIYKIIEEKKITVYALLGMVKDGNVPKRIIYDQFVYAWNSKIENYQREVDEKTTLNWDYIAINCLNEPVEILNKPLEEEKKIPEKLKIEQDTPTSNYYIRNENGTKCDLTKHSKMIAETLNQLLDYLKSKGGRNDI